MNRDFQIEEPKKIEIGNNVGISIRSFISGGGGVSIGDNVLIGPNVNIFSANHNYKAPNIPINKQGHTLKKVIIKNNVWIGSNSIILPGVTIHENVVIGAGSVVSKDCESNSLYAGNPAKLIKKLY
ncbi:acyltransferase [Parabacteroides pacaensis]|uniref:acyltransferase n=1 Tax=Parabacteroides pacaensis TaxID=2086575 RepID=UPI00131A65B1|nr:acyltransferase [Parabacteroides pacaensis]